MHFLNAIDQGITLLQQVVRRGWGQRDESTTRAFPFLKLMLASIRQTLKSIFNHRGNDIKKKIWKNKFFEKKSLYILGFIWSIFDDKSIVKATFSRSIIPSKTSHHQIQPSMKESFDSQKWNSEKGWLLFWNLTLFVIFHR